MLVLIIAVMKSSNPYYNQGMHRGAPPSAFAKARELRKKMTPSEIKLWEYLKRRRFQGLKFRRQHPIHIYIVDFYCHKLKLAIELDGGYHNKESQIIKDNERTKILEFQGLYLLRFSNKEVENDIESVLEKLRICVLEISNTF